MISKIAKKRGWLALGLASVLVTAAFGLKQGVFANGSGAPPPNFFPAWLTTAATPIHVPTTYEVPWINTFDLRAHGPVTTKLRHGSFVSCSGSPVGMTPQNLASSLNGNFGGTHLIAAPCASPLSSSTCLPQSPQDIATAVANAYVSLNAFWSYFASLGWRGFDNSGDPIRIEFGEMPIPTPGWNAVTGSPIYCPGKILHIDGHSHELVHGLVDATAGFQYYGSGSGGWYARVLNEVYADFFAEMIQFHAEIPESSRRPGSFGDYEVSTAYSSLSVSGNFYAPSRPCISDPINSGSGNADYSAGGPIRHAMYLLAEGTDPVNLPHSDVCQGPAVLFGIGREKTARIWLDALTQCDWRQDGAAIDFCDARRCTIAAAACPERNKVIAAWNAVELTTAECGIAADQLCALSPSDPGQN